MVRDKANSIDPDEVAHNEPPHLDLHCLQFQLASFLPILVFTRFSGCV